MVLNIRKRIKTLIAEHGTSNPFRLCDALGIIVVTQPIAGETRGIIRVYKERHIICIDSGLSEIEQQITCAHELGHFILHRNINTLFLNRCTLMKTDIYEIQADRFAELLIQYLYKNI